MKVVYLSTWCPTFINCPTNLKIVDSPSSTGCLHFQSIRVHSLAKQTRAAQRSFPIADEACVNTDQMLLSLLRQRKTEEAWALYSHCPHLPNSVCLSRLVSQLAYQNTHASLSRSQSIITRLRNEGQLNLLDCNSLGLLIVSAVKSDQLPYSISLIKFMLRSGYLPHVKAWTAVVCRLATSPDDGPNRALELFSSIIGIIRRLPDKSVAAESLPDTTAFNNALNACANIGDENMFLQIFEEMAEFDILPDIISFNILIKLCARCNRIDLLVHVLERIIQKGIPLCISTFQSLVAAYVGFGELETAELLVQAMREGKKDVCKMLRMTNLASEDEDSPRHRHFGTNRGDGVDVFQKLVPNCADDQGSEPPLLPKVFVPNSRIYTTLMKGYMKHGRLTDTLTMLKAMQHEDDSSSQPDNVSYTTVVSAFVKLGEVDQAHRFLYEMRRMNVPVNRITYNILLKGYCHQLQIDNAKNLLEEMINDGNVEPDAVSYNTLIDGCIKVDDSAGALSFFNEMRTKGIAPTKVSYTTLMKAFSVSGQPKLANKVLDEMLRDPRLKVDLIAWNTLIEGYCKLGLVDEAKKIVEKMKEMGTYPDVATYGSLANGIALARRPGEALLLWKEVKERCDVVNGISNSSKSVPQSFKPDYELLDTLGDVFLRAAFFQKALEVVACMEEFGISPNKSKYKKIYVEMHSRMFTSKHASQARQDRRKERKRAAEAFKFWLGLPNSYYESNW